MSVREERDSGFELLRLLLMFLIVIHHAIVHGLGLRGLASADATEVAIRSGDMALFCLANGFCIVAVNAFVLISGYFGIRPSKRKVLGLLLAMLFYTLLFTTGYYLMRGDLKHAVSSLLLLSHGRYWFLTDYFFLLCFAAPLNLFFERCGRRETGLFVLSLLVISSYFGFVWGHAANTNGYTLLQFIMLYALGRYVRIGGFDLARGRAAGLYLLCAGACGVLTCLCVRLGQNDWAWRMTYYNDPLLVAAAVGVLLLFRRVRFNSRAVNSLAASALAVYLFQSSAWAESLLYPFVRKLYSDGHFSGGGILLIIIGLAALCVAAALVVDRVQRPINEKLVHYIFKR